MAVVKAAARPTDMAFVHSPDKQLVFQEIPRGMLFGRIEVTPISFLNLPFFNCMDMFETGVYDAYRFHGRSDRSRSFDRCGLHDKSKRCRPAWNYYNAGRKINLKYI